MGRLTPAFYGATLVLRSQDALTGEESLLPCANNVTQAKFSFRLSYCSTVEEGVRIEGHGSDATVRMETAPLVNDCRCLLDLARAAASALAGVTDCRNELNHLETLAKRIGDVCSRQKKSYVLVLFRAQAGKWSRYCRISCHAFVCR